MKLNPNYVLKEFAGETVLVYQDEKQVDFSKIIHLNEIGKLIYNGVGEGKSEKDIVGTVLNEYEIDEPTASKDVHEYLGKLLKMGIVHE